MGSMVPLPSFVQPQRSFAGPSRSVDRPSFPPLIPLFIQITATTCHWLVQALVRDRARGDHP
jgi:hypothetical protein